MKKISVVCVNPTEYNDASIAAAALRKLGVVLMVFSDQKQMDFAVAALQSIPAILVIQLQASAFASYRHSLELDLQD